MRARQCLCAAGLVLLAGCAHGSSSSAKASARQAVVEAKLPELQSCWSELPADQRTRAGSLLFAVDIRRNGTVDWVTLEVDELGVPALSACAVRRVKRWRFPEDRRQTIQFGVGFAP